MADSKYAIAHVGTGHYLIFKPSLALGVDRTYEPERAQQYDTATEASLELLQLREFSGAYTVAVVAGAVDA